MDRLFKVRRWSPEFIEFASNPFVLLDPELLGKATKDSSSNEFWTFLPIFYNKGPGWNIEMVDTLLLREHRNYNGSGLKYTYQRG